MNFENGDYVEANMDLSSLNRKKQNIFSIGENIDVWSKTADGYYNLHFYYPNATAHDHKLRFSAVIGEIVGGDTRRTKGIIDIADESNLTIRVDKMGFWIDGTLITSSNYTIDDERPANTYYGYFMDHFRTGSHNLQIGSTEGTTRTWAYYNYIMYHIER